MRHIRAHQARVRDIAETLAGWLLDVVFDEDDCRILSDDGQKTLDIFRKFALLLHKTFIAENHLKCSLKNHMFCCLLDDDLLLQVCS